MNHRRMLSVVVPVYDSAAILAELTSPPAATARALPVTGDRAPSSRRSNALVTVIKRCS